jgi:hypothetical protein
MGKMKVEVKGAGLLASIKLGSGGATGMLGKAFPFGGKEIVPYVCAKCGRVEFYAE